ncbi:ras guanine nucleotide exchange factor domain-containing protein [Spinellus fusiger]|nr:ras guanine nucleotide exchange factor domain-containing protein [Spinellus fusiger]
MSTSEICCRVYALYPYTSTDSTSLSFEKGAIIDVLAKLESGWWDGWCNKKRGWFPSNYVQGMPESPPSAPRPPLTPMPASMPDPGVDPVAVLMAEERKDPAWLPPAANSESWHQKTAQHRPGSTHKPSRQLRLSLNVSDMLIVEPSHLHTPTSAPDQEILSNWIQQTTEDGSETYYYNIVTNEMRYSIPWEDTEDNDPPYDRDREKEREKVDKVEEYEYVQRKIHHTMSKPPSRERQSSPHHASPFHSRKASLASMTLSVIEDECEEKPARPKRSMSRFESRRRFGEEPPMPTLPLLSIDLTVLRLGTSERESIKADQLPPHWIKQSTPKGRVYFCNTTTDETTWHSEDIDPVTGKLKPLVCKSPTALEPHPPKDDVLPGADASPQSWSQLSFFVSRALQELRLCVKEERYHAIQEKTNVIVYRIRFLLCAANLIDKESSPVFKTNKQLQVSHRGVLASLAKLVLASKMASGASPTPDVMNRLVVDTDEVLYTVRNFIITAQDLSIDLHDSQPKIVDETSLCMYSHVSPLPSPYTHPTESIAVLLVLSDTVQSAIASFTEALQSVFGTLDFTEPSLVAKRIKSAASVLVDQFRHVSHASSQFLSALDTTSSPSVLASHGFAKHKQAMLDAMGTLLIASQTITSPSLGSERTQTALDQLNTTTKVIQRAVMDMCEMSQPLMMMAQGTMSHGLGASGYGHSSSHFSMSSGSHSMSSSRSSSSNTETPQQPATPATPTTDSHRQPLLDALYAIQKRPSLHEAVDTREPLRSPHIKDGLTSPGTFSPLHMSSLSSISEYSEPELMGRIASRQSKYKIVKFFGEDTAASALQCDPLSMSGTPQTSLPVSIVPSASKSSPPQSQQDTPAFLATEYCTSAIIFNMEGNVKGGTIQALIQRLTQHDQLDSKFINTFLLTYRSFCTTQELFEGLFARYKLAPPAELTEEQVALWKEKKLKLVRLRVFNVIKSWLDTYYNEEEDQPMLSVLMEFTKEHVQETMRFGYEQLAKLIKIRMDAEENGQIRKMTLNIRTEMPAPILPKNMKRVQFLEIDPLEIARQLTIMDFRLYNRIKPVECLDKNWGRGDADNIAANVKTSIEYSNQVTAWVTDSILSKEDIKKRAAVLKHWVLVAEKCRILNNYNTCMAILSSFDNSSVGRLRRTWELITARVMQILISIRRLMGANRNFTEYRDIIHRVNLPCLPFLGIYLQDLTFIEDGNSNYLKKTDNMINFSKRMKTAEVIRELQQYQSTPYLLQAVPDIQEFITTHLQSSRDEETLYNLSLLLEPRERDEDTIVRRLKESGM